MANKKLKKTLVFVFLISTLVMLTSFISAQELDIKVNPSEKVMIPSINNPAIFNLSITNFGKEESIKITNSWGFPIEPEEVNLSSNERKNVEIKIYPRENLDKRGAYALNVKFKGQDKEEVKRLVYKILDLEDIFEISSEKVYPSSETAKVHVKNKEKVDFENISLDLSSKLFETEEKFSLKGEEEKEIEVPLQKENLRKLSSGYYSLTGKFNIEGVNAEIEEKINFAESKILDTQHEEEGTIVQTEKVKKINNGNVEEKTEFSTSRNIIVVPFTSITPSPDVTEREGFTIYYTWTENLSPGEELTIILRTNWLIPILVILLIIAVPFLFNKYYQKNISIKKNISFVRAKGGEFALKIKIGVHAKRNIERISIIDKLPPLVKLYEKFSGEEPTSVDYKNKRIKWDFESLQAGETRVISYIVYSKFGILGKFVLPSAEAIYERNGKIKETKSNRAFFVSGANK